MKKLSVLLLLLVFSITLNTLFSAQTQALYLDENGAEWWSTEELTITTDDVKINFPWWLGVILGLNGLVLIWLFLPTGTAKPKKTKKSLDKMKRLR
jgi:hypothetical protein